MVSLDERTLLEMTAGSRQRHGIDGELDVSLTIGALLALFLENWLGLHFEERNKLLLVLVVSHMGNNEEAG